ncbi:MAG: DUF1150 family protein [Alphaproteobacteria bacterium]|nr:DUF1150 family protein [Alphaproteobacteria bacterium]MBO4644083.1 DUF1150 family protein [Alphaproteobacteria bacterium]
MQFFVDKKDITADDLAKLGVNTVAYIRKKIIDHHKMWFIYAAEGTELAYTDDENKAISLVIDNELIPVSVH